jgi:predicted nucleic acid-binding protein
VKWYATEELSEIALQLQQGYLMGEVDLFVPELLYFEVLNALRYKPDYGIEQLTQISQDLEDYQFNIVHFNTELMTRTVELALQYGITVYDSSYLALAKQISADLITADQKFLNKIGDREEAKHLRDFELL